jgi:HD superfamily phosphodiesterase
MQDLARNQYAFACIERMVDDLVALIDYLLDEEVEIIEENTDVNGDGVIDIDDLSALKLARDIANKIEATMSYPGIIKVNVIRETRAVDYAK